MGTGRYRCAMSPRRVVLSHLLDHDRSLGAQRIAGADEAGRGCLAGPLVAAVVCLDLRVLGRVALHDLARLDDSKRLSPGVRAQVASAVMRHAEQVVVVSACAATIDLHGLHRTNVRLMADALRALDPVPDICLVDGFDLGPSAPAHRQVIKGDSTSAAIAAASVVAKEARDRLMRGPAALAYPGYGFDRHVGYITTVHRDAVQALGPTPLHRRSFRSSAYGNQSIPPR